MCSIENQSRVLVLLLAFLLLFVLLLLLVFADTALRPDMREGSDHNTSCQWSYSRFGHISICALSSTPSAPASPPHQGDKDEGHQEHHLNVVV